MSDPAADHRQLLAALLGPPGPELSCEECFEHLHRYVDLQHAGANADHAIPGMRAHLHGCPACHDDHASLHALIATEDQLRAL